MGLIYLTEEDDDDDGWDFPILKWLLNLFPNAFPLLRTILDL